MAHELFRLIARYRWLQQELSAHAQANETANAAHVAEALEEVFVGIVQYKAEDPEISYCQIEFLLSMLTEGTRDRKIRQMLRDAALMHVKWLADRAAPATVAAE